VDGVGFSKNMTLANRITGAWWARKGEGEKGSNDAFIKK